MFASFCNFAIMYLFFFRLPSRLLVLLCTLAVLCFSAWSLTQLEVAFDGREFLSSSSYLSEYFGAREEHFQGNGHMWANAYVGNVKARQQGLFDVKKLF